MRGKEGERRERGERDGACFMMFWKVIFGRMNL
jgi:hypothetical protein